MTVFNPTTVDHLHQPMFFGEELSIARYEKVKYPIFDKLSEKQLGFFWLPQEVDISQDSKDFKALNDYEQHIFTSNIKRQTLLDTVQGRAPIEAFLPICSLPELENWIVTWAANETVHSRAYTHVIRNIYPDPSLIFDELLDIKEIVDCAHDISKYYDDLVAYNNISYSQPIKELSYDHKKKLWLALNSVNALEGIRFYVSFACSWAFGELKKMEGNAKIIKLICRDENVHLAGTQHMLKMLPKDDPTYIDIKDETKDEVRDMFIAVVDQEKDWAKFLFQDGSMIGLNEKLLVDYMEWLAHKRMNIIGIESPYKGGSDPLPWTQKWISGSEVQVAPQETELTSYTTGGIVNDFNAGDLKGFKL